jgi:hypothetical protein
VPLTIPSSIYPVFESSLLVGRETTIDTAPTAFTGIPTGPLQTNQKVTWLEDMNLRGSNVKVYDLEEGPVWAEITIPESPLYGDTIGNILFSLLGDYTTTGTAGTPTWTTSGALSAGATSIAVTTGSVATSGTFIQVDTGVNAEVVTVGTGSTSTNIVLNTATPLRFSHLTTISITTVVAPFTHVFSLINPSSSTGNTSAQPPTYTFLHRNLIAGSGNYYADQYSYTRMTDLTLTAKKDGWFSWSGKAVAYLRGYPSANYAPSFTTVKAQPSWKSVISLASTTTYNVSEISFNLSREMDIVTTADGSQNPYVIAAGPVTATFNMDFDAASDESPLTAMLNNTQGTLSYTLSNGGSGAGLVSTSIAAQQAGYKNSPLSPMKSLWGWKVSGDLVANTTNSGNSGGYSPIQVTLQNAISSY